MQKISAFSSVKPEGSGKGNPLLRCAFMYGKKPVLRIVDIMDCKHIFIKQYQMMNSQLMEDETIAALILLCGDSAQIYVTTHIEMMKLN